MFALQVVPHGYDHQHAQQSRETSPNYNTQSSTNSLPQQRSLRIQEIGHPLHNNATSLHSNEQGFEILGHTEGTPLEGVA